MSRKIIILGALSAIAEATARRYANQGAEFVLVARNALRVEHLAQELENCGAKRCETRVMEDAYELGTDVAFDEMVAALGGHVDLVYVFYGFLGNNYYVAQSSSVLSTLRTHFSSAAEWCMAAARQFEQQRAGVLIAVCSVMADPVVSSDEKEGEEETLQTKGLSHLIEEIAQRLSVVGAHAVVAKLGLLSQETDAAASVSNEGPLLATPARVAEQLLRIEQNPDTTIVYIPGFWRTVTAAVRDLPSRIFQKTKS